MFNRFEQSSAVRELTPGGLHAQGHSVVGVLAATLAVAAPAQACSRGSAATSTPGTTASSTRAPTFRPAATPPTTTSSGVAGAGSRTATGTARAPSFRTRLAGLVASGCHHRHLPFWIRSPPCGLAGWRSIGGVGADAVGHRGAGPTYRGRLQAHYAGPIAPIGTISTAPATSGDGGCRPGPRARVVRSGRPGARAPAGCPVPPAPTRRAPITPVRARPAIAQAPARAPAAEPLRVYELVAPGHAPCWALLHRRRLRPISKTVGMRTRRPRLAPATRSPCHLLSVGAAVHAAACRRRPTLPTFCRRSLVV